MNEQLKNAQLSIFSELPEETRTLLIQLAQFRPKKKIKQILEVADVKASAIIIIKKLCEVLNLSADELRNGSSKRTYNDARYMAYFLLRSNKIGTKEIGLLFKRDHSTVCHGTAMHFELKFSSRIYRENYEKVVSAIKLVIADQEAVEV